jgi:hypothetical protein
MYLSTPLATSTLKRVEWPPPSRPGLFNSLQENLSIVRGVQWVTGPVLTCMKNLVLKEILNPIRQPVAIPNT